MDRAYEKIEVVGVSDESVADAVRKAVSSAAQKHKGLSWFEVSEIRGRIDGEKVAEFQVTVKIGGRMV